MLPRFATSLWIALATFVVAVIPAFAESDTAVPQPALELPSWMTPDVMKTALAIHLTDAQQHEFNDAVGDYVTGRFAMIQKEGMREAPDLDQRVKSRDNALVRQMDTRMHGILTSEQWPAYESYRKALRTELKSAPLPQTSNRARTPPGIGGGQG